MTERKGEKIGWTWGWIGGFLWVPILSIVFCAQGKWAAGAVGLLFFVLVVGAVWAFAPWRHPTTPYWRLMAVGYGLFLLSSVWAFWAFEATREVLTDGWQWLWLGPVFLPVFLQGRRTWRDGESKSGRDSL